MERDLFSLGPGGAVPAVSNCRSSLSLDAQVEGEGLGPVIWECAVAVAGEMPPWFQVQLLKGPCYPVSKHMLLCMALVTSLHPVR